MGVLCTYDPSTFQHPLGHTESIDQFGRNIISPIYTEYEKRVQKREKEREKYRVRESNTRPYTDARNPKNDMYSSTSSTNNTYSEYILNLSIYKDNEYIVQYNNKINSINTAINIYYNDVKIDLISITILLSQLHMFRLYIPGRYLSAYISLSLPVILEPFILLECITKLFEKGQNYDRYDSNDSDNKNDILQLPIIPIQLYTWYQDISDFAQNTEWLSSPTATTTVYRTTAGTTTTATNSNIYDTTSITNTSITNSSASASSKRVTEYDLPYDTSAAQPVSPIHDSIYLLHTVSCLCVYTDCSLLTILCIMTRYAIHIHIRIPCTLLTYSHTYIYTRLCFYTYAMFFILRLYIHPSFYTICRSF